MNEEIINYDGDAFLVKYDPILECESCGEVWTEIDQRDPQCLVCDEGNEISEVGKRYETYLKYSLFNGEESRVSDVNDSLRSKIKFFEAMKFNGWDLSKSTQSSRVIFTKGELERTD